MEVKTSLAEKLLANIAAQHRVSRRTLLGQLGVTAGMTAAAGLGMPVLARAQEATSKPAPKALPKRRSMPNHDRSAPAPTMSPSSKSSTSGDDESVPGGLPGAKPRPVPVPGGPPGGSGG